MSWLIKDSSLLVKQPSSYRGYFDTRQVASSTSPPLTVHILPHGRGDHRSYSNEASNSPPSGHYHSHGKESVPISGNTLFLNISLKYWSLTALVVQNSALVLLMKYSRNIDGPLYIASSAVFMMELVKMAACLLLLRLTHQTNSHFMRALFQDVVSNYSETLKLAVPSALYAIQNNLLYIALSHLDAATFQVTYQLKILSTAMFSIWIMKRPLSRWQWLSLVVLMTGVCFVQLPRQQPTSNSSIQSSTPSFKSPQLESNPSDSVSDVLARDSSISDPAIEPDVDHDNLKFEASPWIGLLAVIAACLSSGYSGCYFERALKNSKTNLWTRNIQLGIFSIFFSLLAMMLKDGDEIFKVGMCYGYNTLTWIVILNQALGGLFVAMVVKYADNILKGFATSISIIFSSVLSFWLFEFQPTSEFIAGALLVISSVYIYSIKPLPKAHLSAQ